MNCYHVELRRIGVNREITFLVGQKWQATLRFSPGSSGRHNATAGNSATTIRGMERDEGIEPSPRPWQGRVLPLYESRENEFTFIACGPKPNKLSSAASLSQILKGIRNPRRQKSSQANWPGPVPCAIRRTIAYAQSTSMMRVDLTTGERLCRSAKRVALSRSM